jgi:hypothetical protein
LKRLSVIARVVVGEMYFGTESHIYVKSGCNDMCECVSVCVLVCVCAVAVGRSAENLRNTHIGC